MLAVGLGECRAGAGAQRLPRAGARPTPRLSKNQSPKAALGARYGVPERTPTRAPRMSQTGTSWSQLPPLAGAPAAGRAGRIIGRG